jgi:hypothetical protein
MKGETFALETLQASALSKAACTPGSVAVPDDPTAKAEEHLLLLCSHKCRIQHKGLLVYLNASS